MIRTNQLVLLNLQQLPDFWSLIQHWTEQTLGFDELQKLNIWRSQQGLEQLSPTIMLMSICDTCDTQLRDLCEAFVSHWARARQTVWEQLRRQRGNCIQLAVRLSSVLPASHLTSRPALPTHHTLPQRWSSQTLRSLSGTFTPILCDQQEIWEMWERKVQYSGNNYTHHIHRFTLNAEQTLQSQNCAHCNML